MKFSEETTMNNLVISS